MKTSTAILYGLLLAVALAPAQADTLVLDVDRAVELALENNLAITQALASVEAASAGKAAALGAFLPQVSATAGYYRMAKVSEFTMMAARESIMGLPVFDPNGQYVGSTTPIPVAVGVDTFRLKLGSQNNYTLRGTAQQTVFTWGKLANAYRITGLALDIEKEGLRQAKLQVRTQAVEGFFQALLARKMVGLMRESYTQLERHVAQVQVLYDNGLATRLDLMRAQVGLTNLKSQLTRLESAQDLTQAALRTTLGLEPDIPLELEGELELEAWDIELDPASASALEHRPELHKLRDAVRIAGLGVRIARTANLPSLFAAFNYDYKRPVGFADEWGSDWNITAGASMPLFTGLTNVNKLKQAKAQERQARVALEQVEDAVRLEVKALHSTLRQEEQNIDLQAENVKVAEQALAMAETGYENGLVTNLEYLDTQLALTQSRVSYLSSLANHRIARAKLAQAMGKTEEK